jgi:3-oxoacyl-[acyl-carrier protein] reductase
MELQGQVAIVTGAGRGIGRATALELARMGADIVVAELDRANAEGTASELRGLDRRALVVQTDVTSRDDLRAMVERTLSEFGRIDTLVNNAGIYRAATTLDVTEEHWDAIMNINAKAVFFATQAALPTMIAQKRGVIVSLASMAGKIGSRANLPYNASKAAVISMTKSLALAHAADGIRVELRLPRLRRDRHVDVRGPRAGGAAQPIARRVHPPARSSDPLGANGAPGGRRQRDRVPRVAALGLHDWPGPQRRRRAGHARLRLVRPLSTIEAREDSYETRGQCSHHLRRGIRAWGRPRRACSRAKVPRW